MAAFAGSSGRTEESVSSGCDLRKDERETLRKLIQETVREELKSGGMEQMPACEKEEIPGQMLDFYFRWSRSKGVRPMDKENMALLDLLGFCIHLTWIL